MKKSGRDLWMGTRTVVGHVRRGRMYIHDRNAWRQGIKTDLRTEDNNMGTKQKTVRVNVINFTSHQRLA